MHGSRILLVSAALLLLAVCSGSPAPTTSADPPDSGTGGAATQDPSGLPIQGSTDLGRFGDPCTLLTVDEIQQATGTEVLAIVRGDTEEGVADDPSQLCAYATDGPGVGSADLINGLGGGNGSELGDIVQSISGAGGVVGVLLGEPDLDETEDSIDPDDAPPPQVEIVTLTLGMHSVAVATPNGGYGFAITTDGTEQVEVMNLIGAQTTTAAMTDLITAAFGRL